MIKSIYIIALLNAILFFCSCQASEMKDDEKTDNEPSSVIKPMPLEIIPYEKWSKNRKPILAPFLSQKQNCEMIVNSEDQRKKVEELLLSLSPKKEKVDIVNYIVKLYIYYEFVKDKKGDGKGTATIIKIRRGMIYLLTCAHNIVVHRKANPFDESSVYNAYFAKSVFFSYKGKKYPCKSYYIFPNYSQKNSDKDIAILVSHRGYDLGFPYSFFPEIVSVPPKGYKGYIIGFPAEEDKSSDLYGMFGDLTVKKNYIKYDCIDTSQGQSGSPILAKIEDCYKIIGVHTIGDENCNYGVLTDQEMIKWEEGCWSKAKEIYDRQEKVFHKGSNMMKILKDSIFDVDMCDAYQLTPFLCAAERGDISSLIFLRKKGANVYATDIDRNNALHLASIRSPKARGINWLIDSAKISIESKGFNGKTPFLCAAAGGNIHALKLLKSKSANIHATDLDSNNALHLASLFSSDNKSLQWLIDSVKISIESIGFNAKTPFLSAASKGNLPALKLLKEKGANTEATDEYENNALHLAALHVPKSSVISWLIHTAKLPIEDRGYSQKTPFLCAAAWNNLPALKCLKEKGVNVSATDEYENNALHLAIHGQADIELIEWLIDVAKTNMNEQGYYQKTPFLWAAEKGNLRVLKLLRKKGANVQATDEDDSNALHWAIDSQASFKVIEWLISVAQVNVNVQGYYGRTPFLCAAEKDNLLVLKLLREKGANVDAMNHDFKNALECTQNIDAFKWLKNECNLAKGSFKNFYKD